MNFLIEPNRTNNLLLFYLLMYDYDLKIMFMIHDFSFKIFLINSMYTMYVVYY